MSAPGEVRCERLAWDTDFFGLNIARLLGDRLSPEALESADRWCLESGIQCLYFLARADDAATVRLAERGGFHLVDIRVTLAHAGQLPAKRAADPPAPGAVREARPGDIPALEEIAKRAHRNTRFFSDPNFPVDRAEALYAAWIRRECEGHAQKVLVAVLAEDRPAGYVSCHLETSGGRGQIGLVAVAREAAGRGVGSSLILAALEWFASRGARDVVVVTQGNNLAAQRLYERHGFLARELQLWFHKWYPRVERRHA